MNEVKYCIKKIDRPTADAVILELGNAEGRPIFDFKPGQYVMISYDNGIIGKETKRAFSLASSPTRKDRIRLGIRVGGEFTTGLTRLKAGDKIFVTGPFGKFVFDQKRHQDLVLIAGGIGITPFLSTMEYAAERALQNRLALVYSNKTIAGTLFFDEIRQLEKRNKNMRSVFFVTEQIPKSRRKGVVNGRVSAPLLSKFIGDSRNKTFFICGPAAFMSAMKQNLLSLGIAPRQIEMEEFSMFTATTVWASVKNWSYAAGFGALAMLLPFYFIFHAAQAAPVDKKNGSGSINSSASYDADKVYKIAQEIYDQRILARKTNDQIIEDAARLPSTSSGLIRAEEPVDPAADVPAVIPGADKEQAIPPSAPVDHTPPATDKKINNGSSPAAAKATAAVTKTPAPASKPTEKKVAPASVTPPPPAPTTHASAPAQAEAPAVAPAANQPAPIPVTSASSAPAPLPAPSTQPAPAASPTPAPAPTTSASSPAPAPIPAPSPSPAPAPSPSPTPAPAPAPSPSPSTGSGSNGPINQNHGHDDDDDDD